MPQGFSLGDETQSLEIVESETVYRGAIWDVRRETFDYRGEKLTRDFVDHPGAVSVVALNDNAEIMMIMSIWVISKMQFIIVLGKIKTGCSIIFCY